MPLDRAQIKVHGFVKIKGLEHPKYPGVKVFARVFKINEDEVEVLLPASIATGLNISCWTNYSFEQVEAVHSSRVTLGQLKEFDISPASLVPELHSC